MLPSSNDTLIDPLISTTVPSSSVSLLAWSTGRSRAFLAAEALNEYLDVNEWQVAGSQAGHNFTGSRGKHTARAGQNSWSGKRERPALDDRRNEDPLVAGGGRRPGFAACLYCGKRDAGMTAFDRPPFPGGRKAKGLGSGWVGRRIDSFPQPFASRLPKSHPQIAAVVGDEFDCRLCCSRGALRHILESRSVASRSSKGKQISNLLRGQL